MNKEAVRVGFFKRGMELGLDNLQVNDYWEKSLNYPEFKNQFDKMSEANLDIDIDLLDTMFNLEQLDKMAVVYK